MSANLAQPQCVNASQHHDVIKWKHFPRYWPFVRGIQNRSKPCAIEPDTFCPPSSVTSTVGGPTMNEVRCNMAFPIQKDFDILDITFNIYLTYLRPLKGIARIKAREDTWQVPLKVATTSLVRRIIGFYSGEWSSIKSMHGLLTLNSL